MKQYVHRSLLGLLFTLFSLFQSAAQVSVKGKILDQSGYPIVYANVLIIGTFDGSSSDSTGAFCFTTCAEYPLRMVASHLNYFQDTLEINNQAQLIDLVFRLRNKNNTQLEDAVISVSSFGVGERHTRTTLKALDIYTNPNGNGDLAMGMRQIPGIQDVGDKEGFFIRGGDARETSVIIEGVRIRNFFGQSQPDNAARSRFPAGLFSGLSLATGGYGVSEGGALSGLLRLRLAEQSESSLSASISPLFGSLGQGWQSSSRKFYIEHSASYSNSAYVKLLLKPEYNLKGKNDTWGYTLRTVWQPTEMDEIKTLFMLNKEQIGTLHPSPDTYSGRSLYKGKDIYTFGLLHWKHRFSQKHTLDFSGGYGYNYNKASEEDNYITLYSHNLKEYDIQTHIKMQSHLEHINIKYGADYTFLNTCLSHNFDTLSTKSPVLKRSELAAYTELSAYPWNKGNITAGLRLEYAYPNAGGVQLLPRISVTQQLRSGHTLTADAGLYSAYYENYRIYGIIPTKRERSEQYNLTYEWRPSSTHILRFQIYDKEYKHLTYMTSDGKIENSGHGYARGIDFFWKGSNIINNLEQWLSYSYTDANRTSLFTLIEEQPGYVARHTGSLVLKYWCPKISSLFNISMTYRTGMTYHNPNISDSGYMNATTPPNFNMSASYNFPFKRGKLTGVLVLSAHNLFNSDPTYGYHFSRIPKDKYYPSVRITSPYKQFYMIGFFINIGVDRRNEIMNTDLKIKNK